MTDIIDAERVAKRIVDVRGRKVILDADLAALLEVAPRTLAQALKRHQHRFPTDFLFQLTEEERAELARTGESTAAACVAFTAPGALMAAMVLESPRAVEISVFLLRVFLKVREVMSASRDMTHKLADLERQSDTPDQLGQSFLTALRDLLTPEPKRRPIGFIRPDKPGE